MKKIILFAAAIVAMAGSAMAAGTATVNVTAAIIPTCVITTPAALGFGNLPYLPDGSSAGATATTSVQYRCTTGAAYTITKNNGTNWGLEGAGDNLFDGTANYIPYTMTLTDADGDGVGNGLGAPTTLTIDGTIAAGAYDTDVVGNYADTVTIDIIP